MSEPPARLDPPQVARGSRALLLIVIVIVVVVVLVVGRGRAALVLADEGGPGAAVFSAVASPVVPTLALGLVVALCVFAAAAPEGDGVDIKHFAAIALVTCIGLATWAITLALGRRA